MTKQATAVDPFFAYITPFAPHARSHYERQYENLFSSESAPRPASFDESDVHDKPRFIQELPSLGEAGAAEVDLHRREALRSLQTVDQMVGDLVSVLEDAGQLDNTYIMIISDNGQMLGEHRILTGKQVAYDESVVVGGYIRGPGIRAGSTFTCCCCRRSPQIATFTTPGTRKSRALIFQ